MRTRRRLGPAHFALYRGYLEGLPLDTLAARYLDTHDAREARRVLQWIRDELSMAAARAGDYGAARLLRLPPGVIPAAPAATSLSLDDFRAAHDPEGVYTERELIAHYQEAYGTAGADRKAVRNARLLQRQNATLATLAAAHQEEPAAHHPLAGWVEWIGPRVTERLQAVALTTVGELVDFMNRHGYRWFVRVPRLGEKTAVRLATWLQAHAASIGRPLALTATQPRRAIAPAALAAQRAPSADIAPLEHYRPPAALDGSTGTNRAPTERNKTGAANDYAAIQAWIALKAGNAHTQRTRQKEAERFLLWAIVQQGKPLSSLTVADAAAYLAFLADPQPAARWIGSRRVPRWHPDWRPFDGPLAPSSQVTAYATLNGLCAWLARQHYLDASPFDGVPKPIATAGEDPRERSLSRAHWQYLLHRGLDATPAPARARARFALWLAYGTGLRRAELARATVGDLRRRALDDALQDAWMLKVLGKRQRVRYVPFPPLLFTELAAYLAARGLPADPEAWPAATPLLSHLDHGTPLTEGAIAALYKGIFQRAADQLDSERAGAGWQLRQASTHWLRHTHGSHAAEAGMPLETVRATLGHASLTTTSVYVHADDARRYREASAFLADTLGQLTK
ncbi:phage integrase family protein [Cupriavidus basilensis]